MCTSMLLQYSRFNIFTDGTTRNSKRMGYTSCKDDLMTSVFIYYNPLCSKTRATKWKKRRWLVFCRKWGKIFLHYAPAIQFKLKIAPTGPMHFVFVFTRSLSRHHGSVWLLQVKGHNWFFQISSQWESQKNRSAFISFGKILFEPPCIWDHLLMSYRLWLISIERSVINRF